MLIAILSGFIFAVLLVFIGRMLKGKLSILSALIPVGLFSYFCSFIPEIAAGKTVFETYSWVPSMGVDLNFNLDGLALIFALMITGIGSLVFIYTSNYLKGDPYIDRFYGYLSMFMAAMLGLVLSDNLVAIFVFWELTSITSFFLIGYKNEDRDSRKAAMIALAVTGIGGMFLFAGVLVMGAVAGTYSFQEMLSSGVVFQDHALYPIILFFVFGGAFTKSAQFPFHYWLPDAMRAPTPVSTYLHSATMVKAGIYILLRFTPALGNHAYWSDTLMLVGGITMVYTAYQALFRTDLKGVLAYSTIAALGMLTFLIGMGTEAALLASVVFILVHALYKATLFLVAGIIDHQTGTRDITKLRGLGKLMIPVALASVLAALSNSGIPPTFGFIGKELIYESTREMGSLSTLLTVAAIATNVFLIYAGFVAGVKPFLGKLPPALEKVQMPSPLLWAPALLLGIGCLFFGLFPAFIESAFARPALASLGYGSFDFHLKLWHGFNTVFILSLITMGVGLLLYFSLKPSHKLEAVIAKLEPISPRSLTILVGKGFRQFSLFWTRFFQNGFLRYYVIVIMGFLVVLTGYNTLTETKLVIPDNAFDNITIYEVITLVIMVVSIGFAVFSSSRLAAVAALGVLGYAICLIFVFYSAPDLAMTQFSIDTLTVILFVLVLYRLPKYLKLSDMRSRVRDMILALIFGALITTLALEVLSEPIHRETSEFYAENAYVLAKGKNVVNVILVDFRGIDTMVEITVLVIAAIGVFGLLKLRLKKSEVN
jgi:multicomponent Na+:H+ antiporter subunit A